MAQTNALKTSVLNPVLVNPALQVLLGINAEGLIGTNQLARILRMDPDAVGRNCRALLAEGYVVRFEGPVSKANARKQWFYRMTNDGVRQLNIIAVHLERSFRDRNRPVVSRRYDSVAENLTEPSVVGW